MADLFVYGRFSLLEPQDEKLFMFEKTFGRDGLKAFVVLNFSAEEVDWKGPGGVREEQMQLLISTVGEGQDGVRRSLAPWEGRVYLIN